MIKYIFDGYKEEVFMSRKHRKYARPSKKSTPSAPESYDTEYTLSTSAAIGILGVTFLVGLATGKLIDMCK